MANTNYDYLFVPDVKALRRKVRNATGALGYLCRASEGHSAFRYLVTGKDDYARKALDEINATLDRYLAGEFTYDVHFHTWCNAAPMARTATNLDWIADSPAVSKKDFARIKEAILDYTLKHPFTRMKGRIASCDNQIGAMSFCCALVGYLFGVKRGRDLRAQRLMAAGLTRFPDMFGLSEPGGYSYEGSTYFCEIVSPITCWFTALAEQITGEDCFTRRYEPNGVSPETILRMYQRMVGPSGLMPPWDNYGWMRCCSTMGLAYLAMKTGDPAPLKIMEAANIAAEPVHVAWGTDDRIWTILWWPERLEIGGTAGAFRDWAVDNVAAALVSERNRWRLFQCWDQCGAGVYCGRAQVNPNMISLDLWGSPIFTDGTPDHSRCTLFDYPLDAFRQVLKPGEVDAIRNYYLSFNPKWDEKTWIKGFSFGCIGASNSIVVNDEGHYSPAEGKEGKLVAFGALPNFKLAAAETANFYQPRYPIESMVRTSVLVRDDYFLVSDTIRVGAGHCACPSRPLRFDWQVFARGTVTAENNRTKIVTGEQVQLDILPLNPDAAVELVDVPGFPKDCEGRSTRVRYRVDGSDVLLPFLLVPHRLVKPVADLADGWSVQTATRQAGADAGLPSGLRSAKTVPAFEIGLAANPAAGHDSEPHVWASRTFSVPASARGKRLLIGFTSAVNDLQVWVNGTALAMDGLLSAHGEAGDRLVPLIVEIPGPMKTRNTVVIAGTTMQGKLVNGPVNLMIEDPAPALPTVKTLGAGHYEIAGSFGRDELLLNPTGQPVSTDAFSFTGRALLISAHPTAPPPHHPTSSFAALQATRLQMGEADGNPADGNPADGNPIDFHSDRPIDVSCENGVVTLGDLSGPERVELITAEFSLRVKSRGVVEVDLSGVKRPKIVARLAQARPVFCNGRLVEAEWNRFDGTLVIPADVWRGSCKSDPAMPQYVKRMEKLMCAASKADAASVAGLIDSLRSDIDWKVQMMAAELLGRIGGHGSVRDGIVAALLDALKRETPEAIYDDSVLLWWRDANEKFAKEGPAPFLKGAGSSADAVKRHRVKTVIIEALGRLRAAKAVPELCRIIEDQREFYPVHSAACRALGFIGDPAAIPALERAAEHPESNTKLRAADAINRIKTGKPINEQCPDHGAR